MDDLSRKFRSIDWKGIQRSVKKVQASTASALKDMVMTDLENKTRAATADTSWGASGTDLMAIAHGTYRREDYGLIMSILWQRLASTRWRCVYKALELLKFLVMHGAASCSDEARAALPHLRALTDYVATDERGRDVGDGVRRRALLVCEMLTDESVLEAERANSRELRSKLQGGDGGTSHLGGLSSDDYRLSSARSARSYGTSYQDSDSPTRRNRSTTSATPSFKGYGDYDDAPHDSQNEDDTSPYDDVSEGQFAQRAQASATVDDLLGGEEPSSALASGKAINAVDDLLGNGDESSPSNVTAASSNVFQGFPSDDGTTQTNATDMTNVANGQSKALVTVEDLLAEVGLAPDAGQPKPAVNGNGVNSVSKEDDDDDDDFNPRGAGAKAGTSLDWL